jgi:DNA-binding transcriptional MocR family regulator
MPTHASIASQVVAAAALDPTGGGGGSEVRMGLGSECFEPYFSLLNTLPTNTTQWTKRQVATLRRCRERLWAVLCERCPGSVRTEGAFYFLARLPEGVAEEEAVRTLATEFRVLSTPGKAFGAPGHLRLSYGSLPEAESMAAFDRLDEGLATLADRAVAAVKAEGR